MPTSGTILALRHEPFEHLGYFADVLREYSIPFEYRDLGDELGLVGRSGLIVMGGPQSANDVLPALTAELHLITQAIQTGIPVLGICLGSQLIAKALGARVYRNPRKEIGWFPIHFTEAARQDPLFSGIPSPATFFHWHGETFDLPAGAEWLAYSDRCKHQAFRYPGNIYGIQFHPEITPAMVEDWCVQPVNCGDMEDLAGPIDPYAAETSVLARRVLDGWLRESGLL